MGKAATVWPVKCHWEYFPLLQWNLKCGLKPSAKYGNDTSKKLHIHCDDYYYFFLFFYENQYSSQNHTYFDTRIVLNIFSLKEYFYLLAKKNDISNKSIIKYNDSYSLYQHYLLKLLDIFFTMYDFFHVTKLKESYYWVGHVWGTSLDMNIKAEVVPMKSAFTIK